MPSDTITDLTEQIEQTAASSMETLMETEKIKLEDGTLGLGLGMSAVSASSLLSGDIVTAVLTGAQGAAYTGFSIAEGDYPHRAATPFYRAREAGRGHIYDMFRSDEVQEELDIDTVKDEYNDIDIEEQMIAHYDVETAEEAYEQFKEQAVEVGREHYIEDPVAPAIIADTVLNEGLRGILPDYRVSPDVEQVYDTDDLDPYQIKQELIQDFGDFLLDELDGERAETVEQGIKAVQDEEPDQDRLSDIGVPVDAEQDEIYESVIDEMAFQGRCIAQNMDESFQQELEGRYNAVKRFDAGAAEEVGEHEYEVYQVEDPAVIAAMNQELGTCKYKQDEGYNKFRKWAENPGTTILGFRRDDEDEWVGFTRNYDLDAAGRDVFGVDTWEIPYKDGREGGTPEGACDFEHYSDVLQAEALASVRWGLDQGHDYVVSGTQDGRIKHARNINPNRDTAMALRGLDTKAMLYGFKSMIGRQEQTVHVLMEDCFDEYAV